MILNVQNLVKEYPAIKAVDNVSFSIGAGEILGFVGPNGAGKTTTLRSIAGIIPVTSGSISICGHDLVQESVEAKKQLAFIADDPRFFPYMTIWDHILVVSRLYQVKDGPERGMELLRSFELTDRKDSFPGDLSRGMKQKLGLVLALIHRPKLVIMDEPLTGLDPIANRMAKEHIRQIAAEGVSIIVSSHMLHLIEELCGRILVINQGQIILKGSLEEIRKSLPGLSDQADLEDIFIRAVRDVQTQ